MFECCSVSAPCFGRDYSISGQNSSRYFVWSLLWSLLCGYLRTALADTLYLLTALINTQCTFAHCSRSYSVCICSLPWQLLNVYLLAVLATALYLLAVLVTSLYSFTVLVTALYLLAGLVTALYLLAVLVTALYSFTVLVTALYLLAVLVTALYLLAVLVTARHYSLLWALHCVYSLLWTLSCIVW